MDKQKLAREYAGNLAIWVTGGIKEYRGDPSEVQRTFEETFYKGFVNYGNEILDNLGGKDGRSET